MPTRVNQPGYHVTILRCPHGTDGMLLRLRKQWWGGPGTGGTGRVLHEFCIPVKDVPESEMLARGLEAVAAALRG